MREILFRGKQVDNGEWIYGSYLNSEYEEKTFIVVFDGIESGVTLHDSIQVIPETIGQFTGLTDKNGVKIFEGDIIKTDDNDIINVSYGIQNIDAFETIGFNLYEFYGNYEDRGKGIRLQSSIEIIGNIHDA